MAINTRKISDWLSANGQAVTNASLNTMKPYLEKNMAQLYDGVLIMYHRASDGYPLMVAPAQWPSLEAGGEIADGVVIFEGGRHLVVAPTQADTLPWSSAEIQADLPNYGNDDTFTAQVTGNNRLAAMLDFNGRQHTDAAIRASSDSHVTNTAAYAPGYCRLYSRANSRGKGLTAGYWWLPSVGELLMMYANKAKINYALSLIKGAHQLDASWYWSSTEFSPALAWILNFGVGYLYTWDNKVKAKNHVRPVSAFLR